MYHFVSCWEALVPSHPVFCFMGFFGFFLGGSAGELCVYVEVFLFVLVACFFGVFF